MGQLHLVQLILRAALHAHPRRRILHHAALAAAGAIEGQLHLAVPPVGNGRRRGNIPVPVHEPAEGRVGAVVGEHTLVHEVGLKRFLAGNGGEGVADLHQEGISAVTVVGHQELVASLGGVQGRRQHHQHLRRARVAQQ